METSTHDKIEGAFHEAKGKVKETVGKVIGNPEVTAEGQDENLAGKIQTKVGEIKQVFEK